MSAKIHPNARLFLDSLTNCPDYEKSQIEGLLLKVESGEHAAQIYEECQDKPNSRYFWNAHYCGIGDAEFFERMAKTAREQAVEDTATAAQAWIWSDETVRSADAFSEAMNASRIAEISADIAQAYESVLLDVKIRLEGPLHAFILELFDNLINNKYGYYIGAITHTKSCKLDFIDEVGVLKVKVRFSTKLPPVNGYHRHYATVTHKNECVGFKSGAKYDIQDPASIEMCRNHINTIKLQK